MSNDITLREKVAAFAAQIRQETLKMVHRAKASHVGAALSMVDILAVLYGRILNVDPAHPESPTRDRFLLSKGHATASLYAALALKGFFPVEWLADYSANGSPLAGHAQHHGVPGVEISSGSLGHGLPIGCGMALSDKFAHQERRVFVLQGDGECNEGAVWEAAAFAAHHKLSTLCSIIDCNRLQGYGFTHDILDMEPLEDKWKSFGWEVRDVDGHNLDQLVQALAPSTSEQPTVVLARTIKGKGVRFMENELLWHYRNPSDEDLRVALRDLEAIEENS